LLETEALGFVDHEPAIRKGGVSACRDCGGLDGVWRTEDLHKGDADETE
jgi:hypothetical protein